MAADTDFHPDLSLGRYLRTPSIGSRTSWVLRALPSRRPDVGPDVVVERLVVAGPPDAPPVELLVYRPVRLRTSAPALLWAHGGGFVIGAPEQDARTCARFALELGITVAAVRYRLAPPHPAPAAVEDAYAALTGLVERAAGLYVDPDRIAVGGASAGGGLTAGLAQLAHDRGDVRPVLQLLVYPMLDDRTVLREDLDDLPTRLWTTGSNRFGWRSYLGVEPGSPEVPAYAAPARREDLSGLPPTWIGVGTLDLFHDEDLAYAARLEAVGVPTRLEVVPGAFHGFDGVMAKAQVSQDFWRKQADALRDAFEDQIEG